MTDDWKPNRNAGLGTRMTVVEVRLDAQDRRFEEHLRSDERTQTAQAKINEAALALIAKLDERADRQDVQFARLIGGVAVLVSVAQFLGPIVIRALGL